MAAFTQRIDETYSSKEKEPGYFGISTSRRDLSRHSTADLPTPAYSGMDLHKSMTAPEQVLYTPLTSGTASGASSRQPSSERRQDEREEREMFSRLEKPRVRYDVEVITKLIVYSGMRGTSSFASSFAILDWLMIVAGIAWIAVEGAPILFEAIGLGLGAQPG